MRFKVFRALLLAVSLFVGIGAFLGTADVKAIPLAIICAVAAFLVYWPFIRRYDNQLLKEEGVEA